jgi:hypothetical protein
LFYEAFGAEKRLAARRRFNWLWLRFGQATELLVVARMLARVDAKEESAATLALTSLHAAGKSVPRPLGQRPNRR